MSNKKPPNPKGVPKVHGKKPSAPKPHSNSGRFDNGPNVLNAKGCAVTALALAGSVLGAFATLTWAVTEALQALL